MNKSIKGAISGTISTFLYHVNMIIIRIIRSSFKLFTNNYFIRRGYNKFLFNSHIESDVISDFIKGNYGCQYGISKKDRKNLVKQIYNQRKYVETATKAVYHIVLVKEILSIPKETEGVIIECGAFKGSTSVSLSLACRLVSRKLIICDSFEGLPAAETDVVRNYPHLRVFGYYDQGMYEGTLEEVKSNISNYGALEVCEFIKGFFSESLLQLKEPVAFAFLDVDLTSSLKDCIKFIWPLMADNTKLYTDDSCDMEVVKIWFDNPWWMEQFGINAPGYVGSGCGLPLDYDACSLGYTSKISDIENVFGKTDWLRYRDKNI